VGERKESSHGPRKRGTRKSCLDGKRTRPESASHVPYSRENFFKRGGGVSNEHQIASPKHPGGKAQSQNARRIEKKSPEEENSSNPEEGPQIQETPGRFSADISQQREENRGIGGGGGAGRETRKSKGSLEGGRAFAARGPRKKRGSVGREARRRGSRRAGGRKTEEFRKRLSWHGCQTLTSSRILTGRVL